MEYLGAPYETRPNALTLLDPRIECAVGRTAVKSVVSPEASTVPLTPGEIADATFVSFRLSQGRPSYQLYFIEYAARELGDRITPSAVAASHATLSERVTTYVHSAAHRRDPAAVEADIAITVGWWQRVVEGVAEGRSPDDLLTNTIEQDYDHLILRGGRDRGIGVDKEGMRSAKHTSKYVSQAVLYGMIGHSTGVPVYDALYAQLGRYLEVNSDTLLEDFSKDRMPCSEMLRRVAKFHLDHYPDDRAKLMPEWHNFLEATEPV